MPDYLRDLREITRRGEGSPLKRSRTLKAIDKLERKFGAAGVDVNASGQPALIRAMTEDAEEFKRMMLRFCIVRLLRHDYADWTGWEYRNEWAEASYAPGLPNRRWRLEAVKTLAILGEQGIGDEIMFSQGVPDAQRLGISTVLECDPRLISVFERSFSCPAKAREDIVNRGASKYLGKPRAVDAFLPIGDLPRLFRKSRQAFPQTPYLKPDPAMVGKWAHLRGKTGVAWRGRRGKFSPQAFGLREHPVCLQYDAWPYETAGMIVPDCDLRNGIEDVLGICANLDRVVTVPQTVVHLAAAQGTKVEVFIPPVDTGRVVDQLNYRYGTDGRMDWYPSVKVYHSLNEYQQR